MERRTRRVPPERVLTDAMAGSAPREPTPRTTPIPAGEVPNQQRHAFFFCCGRTDERAPDSPLVLPSPPPRSPVGRPKKPACPPTPTPTPTQRPRPRPPRRSPPRLGPKHKTPTRPSCRAKKKSPSQGRSQRPRRHSSSCDKRRPRLLTTPIFPSTDSQRRTSPNYWLLSRRPAPGDSLEAKFSSWPLLKLYQSDTALLRRHHDDGDSPSQHRRSQSNLSDTE